MSLGKAHAECAGHRVHRRITGDRQQAQRGHRPHAFARKARGDCEARAGERVEPSGKRLKEKAGEDDERRDGNAGEARDGESEKDDRGRDRGRRDDRVQRRPARRDPGEPSSSTPKRAMRLAMDRASSGGTSLHEQLRVGGTLGVDERARRDQAVEVGRSRRVDRRERPGAARSLFSAAQPPGRFWRLYTPPNALAAGRARDTAGASTTRTAYTRRKDAHTHSSVGELLEIHR